MNQSAPEPAALWRRLLALVYDLLPLLGLWFLAGIAALAVTAGTFNPRNTAHQTLIRALLVGVTAAYFIVSWSRGGQTIGMRAWRLRLVDETNRSLPWPRAALRFAVALISAALLGAGFWWSLFDPGRRTWHDIVAGSRMLHIRKV